MFYKENFEAICIKSCGNCDFTEYIKKNDNCEILCPEFESENSNEGAENYNKFIW